MRPKWSASCRPCSTSPLIGVEPAYLRSSAGVIQALKHRFADMKMWLEACRATTAASVAAIAARSPDAGLSASIAKSYVGEMAPEIVQGCIQNARPALASPGSTTCTCTCGGLPCIGPCSALRSSTLAGLRVPGDRQTNTEDGLMAEVYPAYQRHRIDTATSDDARDSGESIEQFRARARAWLADNMPAIDPASPPVANRG